MKIFPEKKQNILLNTIKIDDIIYTYIQNACKFIMIEQIVYIYVRSKKCYNSTKCIVIFSNATLSSFC